MLDPTTSVVKRGFASLSLDEAQEMDQTDAAKDQSQKSHIGICDLPAEILQHIFAYFRSQVDFSNRDDESLLRFDPDVKDDTESIQNIRLTCRLFCNVSSHLLIPRTKVTINSASVARLEEISQHPIIRKGIQAVRVDLAFISADAAENDRLFTRCLAAAIQERESSLQDGQAQVEPRVLKIYEQWQSCISKMHPGLVDYTSEYSYWYSRFSTDAALPLKDGRAFLQQRFMDQQQILSDGSFVARVVKAIARMPFATRLFMDDVMAYYQDPNNSMAREWRAWAFCLDLERRFPQQSTMDSGELLHDLSQSVFRRAIEILMEEDMLWRRESPVAHLMYTLPAAIQQAGVDLLHLDLQTGFTLSSNSPILNDNDRQSLNALGKKLKVFAYEGPDGLDEGDSDERLQYLRRLLSGDKLIKLCMGCCPFSFPSESVHLARSNFEPLLDYLSPRARLRWVTLFGQSYKAADQMHFALRRRGNKNVIVGVHDN